jgi:hypothetical protein
MPWGVLSVFQDMIESEKFSQAKIFTVFSDRDVLETSKWNIEIVTALPLRLNNLFLKFSKKSWFFWSILDYRNLMFFYIPLMKILSKKIQKYTPPKVFVSSFSIAKNLEFCKTDYLGTFNPIVSLYLHSPMQYIRSHYDEYLQKLTWYKLKIFKKITPKLRTWDKEFTKYDNIFVNSQYTAKLAKEIYNIDWKVKYPQINEIFLNASVNINPNNYYLYVGRLVKFVKEVDKIIHLFNEIQQPLLIMWSGPDEEYLKSIAKWNIIFIGWIQDPLEKMKIIQNAKGLINITKESFGICTVESLLLWVPVFAYNDWASVELIDQDSWILSPDKNQKTLVKYFGEFMHKNRDRQKIQDNIRLKLGTSIS